MVVCSYLHITLPHSHHYADLSECIELLKCLSAFSVCLRLGNFSQLSSMQYMGLCIFSLPISLMMILRMPVLDLIITINQKYDPFVIV